MAITTTPTTTITSSPNNSEPPMTDTIATLAPEATTSGLPFTLDEDPVTDATQDALAFSTRTMVLALRRKSPTFRRSIAPSSVVEKTKTQDDGTERDNVDPEMLSISKHLLDKSALEKITNADNRYRTFLLTYETPTEVLAPGMWLFSIRLMERVDQRTTEYITERAAAVEELCTKYAAEKEKAQRRLRDQL